MIRNRTHRLEELLNWIRMHGTTTLDELARIFDVSTATVRRDIKLLEDDNAVVRTVGGGILSRSNSDVHPTILDPKTAFIDEKIRIAEYCTELVEEHDEIMIGLGTTALLVGRILTGIGDRRFRIVTNSLELALEASAVENLEAVVLGGEVYNRHSAGFTAHDDFFSSCHHNHKVILSADGIDLRHGLTLFDPRFLNVLRKMIAVSRRVILAADSSKIGKVCFDKIVDFSAISLMVTDTNAPADFCHALQSDGVQVVTV